MKNEADCALCGNRGKLVQSHIIPDFFIRSIQGSKPMGKSGVPQPTSILLSTRPEVDSGEEGRGVWEKRTGLKQAMLCNDCEQRFSKHERWFREFFYGKTFPLKKKSLGTVVLTVGTPGMPDYNEIRRIAVDYAHLKLFVLSILWRASKAEGAFLRSVSLGAKHESRLAKMLINDDAGPETAYPVMLGNLKGNDGGSESYIEQPTSDRDDYGYRRSRLNFGGFQFVVYVGSENQPLPDEVMMFSIRPPGVLILPDVDDTPNIQRFASELGRRGGLAKLKERT